MTLAASRAQVCLGDVRRWGEVGQARRERVREEIAGTDGGLGGVVE